MTTNLIAPCGVNCRLCIAYQRDSNRCHGCFSDIKMGHCAKCSIRFCENAASDSFDSCYNCSRFPCARLKRLDKRYRQKYHVSLLNNLMVIKESGVDAFLEAEQQKWRCTECGEFVCIHNGLCIKCGISFLSPPDITKEG